MRPVLGHEIRSALAWMVFPLVPVLLGTCTHDLLNLDLSGNGPDPRDWDWFRTMLLVGPLAGYGFLAGATLGLPDTPGRRGVRGWLARRSIWVAVGPWVGFVFWASLFAAIAMVDAVLTRIRPEVQPSSAPSAPWGESWVGQVVVLVGPVSIAYGWICVAFAALRRARRQGRFRQAVKRGVAVAVGFVGSLIGSFWAATEFWRSYFFDPRVVPVLVAAVSLAGMTGCASTVTYGDVRRRELFQAMLTAWLLGLAMAWRWWSRSHSRPKGPDRTDS